MREHEDPTPNPDDDKEQDSQREEAIRALEAEFEERLRNRANTNDLDSVRRAGAFSIDEVRTFARERGFRDEQIDDHLDDFMEVLNSSPQVLVRGVRRLRGEAGTGRQGDTFDT
ncbi:hypothetical protein [Streptomyces nymphaeiformis]|uniref:Uncharacterized protein n=1 Tax=Streptomyces nymphaeiformis TaxID=2663842 RepID=A0A7W7XF35_9ACTN|nr:hypothetical protein [Streptomyces nymphaeiformis]MBB4984783.1 hypothetical protein [Streptomyces nymphaeiformis]